MVKVKSLRALIFGVFILLTTSSVWALSAMVDRNTIALDETLRLEISTHGKEDLDDINLSGIENNFIIAGSSTRRYASMINGRAERQTTLVLTLKPRALGQAKIPALVLGKTSTQPIDVTVSQPSPLEQELADNSVIIQAEIDKNTAMPGEQVIYTFRLLYRVAIANAEVTDLTIPTADITPLEDNSYQREINGYNYKVVEKRYALHFKQSGHQQWPAQQLSAELSSGSRSRFGFDPFTQGKVIKLSAPALAVEVKEKPLSQTSNYWLPSTELKITQQWQDSIESISVGQPISRKIIITAKGLLAEKISTPHLPKVSGLNVYAEKPEFVNQQWRDGIAGRREETQVIIPTTAGKFTLPAVQVEWWNTNTGQFEIATLPEQIFEVIADPASALDNAETIRPFNTEANAATDHIALNDNSKTATLNKPAALQWIIISITALAGWMLTAFGWYAHVRTVKAKLAKPNDKVFNASSSVHLENDFKQLCEACKANDASASKSLLNQWLGQQSLFDPNVPPDDLQKAIELLNTALYASNTSQTEWDGSQLLAALQSVKTQPQATESALAPLYPVQ